MRRDRLGSTALVSPALLWWAGLLVLPVGLVLAYSFFQRGIYGGVVYDWTLDNYRRAFDGLYLRILWFSVRVAVEATLVSLLIGFPVAYFIATRPPRWRTMLLVLVILPFWTSLLIRTYAWIVLLNDQGLVNRMLREAGLVDESVRLLYNEFAIVVGMVSSLGWILLSAEAFEKIYGFDLTKTSPIVPFSQPGIVTIPLGFLTLILVSLATRKPEAVVQ